MAKNLLRSFVCVIVVLLIYSQTLRAQDIQLFIENFELGGASFTLNSGGPGSNSGNNQWIVNNNYTGGGAYPNTTSQSNTNGGTISFAPYSNYLHIHPQPSGYINGCFDPSDPSDRFAYMEYGVCTYAMDNIHFSFFYHCMGSSSAYGQIYYSVDGGPWTQFGLAQYNNQANWQYVDITDPIFSNRGSLRFGFRWQNDAAGTPYSSSFCIDDVQIVGSYSTMNPVSINVTSVSPNPVCQGSFVTLQYELSDTLCDGNYQIELSNMFGNFTGQFNSWVFSINFPNTSGSVTVQLPNNAAPGDCYRFRINRLSPPPAITGIASGCFQIIECPNVITTLQPVVTLDTNAVCVGSAIDVPFTSTGVYANNNNYIAQLSNADGTWASNPPVVGTFPNNQTYDPALGQLPGNVSGLVPNVAPGCGYYIRVISTNPSAIGSPWGPFCIQQCDITTNDMQDLNFCVSSCDVDPDGENQMIDIDVNTYNNTATYLPGNVFTTQLLSSQTFGQIGQNGILGSVAATASTQLNVHVPCLDSLPIYGIPLGMNYMRIVATQSTQPENSLGSLIRVTIGAYAETPQVITAYSYPDFTPQNTFCVGETVALFFTPYNYSDNSTYMWTCNGINGGQPFVSPSGANSNSLYVIVGGAGTLTFSVQETNYGCVSPWTPPMSITVLGNPFVNITGPVNFCQNDTAHFQVNFYPDTYYSWTNSAPLNTIAYQDTSNNEINVAFNQVGSYTLSVNVLNQCGSGSDSQVVNVVAPPVADAAPDSTSICIGQSASLNLNTGANFSYQWFSGGAQVGNASTVTVSPETTTDYIGVITGQYGCKARDTVTVYVEYPEPPVIYYDSICPGGMNQLTLSATAPGAYSWSTGSSSSSIVVNNTGIYTLSTQMVGEICPDLSEYHVLPRTPEPPILLTDSVCPGGQGHFPIQLAADMGGQYVWSTGSQLPVITVNDTGIYTLDIYMPNSPCPRTLQWTVIPDSCYALPELFFYVPNSFSPNNDGLNEIFAPVISNPELLAEYRMMIFNRWGDAVFDTTDPLKWWNGSYRDGGYYVQEEAYVWLIEYRQVNITEKKREVGHVIVLR